MKRNIVVVSLAILAWPVVCIAYEPLTHSNLADSSAQRSVLGVGAQGNASILTDWGLTSYLDPQQQFDDTQKTITYRIGPPGSATTTTPAQANIQGLVRTGAAIEDDTNRPPCHFFDPTTGQGLNGLGLSVNHSNPEWALGSDYGNQINGPCTTTVTIFGNYLGERFLTYSSLPQKYSLTDANNYLYAALTSTAKSDRKQNFGDLFLSVGHGLHLLEDMAQPQHVRNESHCDDYVCILGLQYQPSKYEADIFNIQYVDQSGNYVPSNFANARDFWTGGGAGLADFTNRNFLSARTLDWVNGSTIGYSSPQLDLTGPEVEEDVTDVYQTELGKSAPYPIAQFCKNQPNSCKLQFLSTTGKDAYTNGDVVNTKAASESVFNSNLTDLGAHKVFTLNIVTEKSAWSFLQPMAIGYGTGLVNYLFRGRLGVKSDPNNINNYIVSNLSSYELKGTVEFYYDDPYGNRYPITSSKTTVDLPGLSSGSQAPSTQSIPVVPPAYPQARLSGSFMAVFDGTIGTEPGIAGKYFVDGVYVQNQNYQGDDQAQLYTSSGVLVNKDDLGVLGSYASFSMGASGGSLYSAGGFPSDASGTDVISEVVRDGAPIVTYPVGTFVDSIAVNDKNLFVAESTSAPDVIDLYDLNGDPVSSSHFSLNVPQVVVTGLAANDNVLCVTGYDPSENSENYLYDLSTGARTTLQASGQFTGGDHCATTSDRVYVVKVGSPNEVDVYNNSGGPITSFPVQGDIEAMGIAATDTHVYVQYWDYNGPTTVSNGYRQGVAIYQRDPATDIFNYVQTIWIPDNNGYLITRDVATDMKSVLANGDH